MNDQTTNQLDMVGTCLNVADKPENFAVWNGQPPLDYGTDLSAIRGEYQAIRALAALADAATTGPAEPKPAPKPPSKTPPTSSPAPASRTFARPAI